MAEHPELWTDRSPERRALYDTPPTFGLAREAEMMRQGTAPEPRRRADRRRRRGRERGPMVTYLRMPWSYGDRSPGDVWHRMNCRRGRHELCGGHTMQLGSAVVFIERRCRWCDAKPQ